MFRTVFPSIIRSLRLYIQHQVYVKQVLLKGMLAGTRWNISFPLATQEIFQILWNTIVHTRKYNSPPSLSILSQISKSMLPQSHIFKTYFNIIVLSTLSFSKWIFFPSGFPSKHTAHTTFLPHPCHMPSLSHSSLLEHTNNNL